MKLHVTLGLLLLASPFAAASTWVVDSSGGGNFTSIQAAIDAAAPGDVLLVKEGFYSAFSLDKDLSILGEPGVRPFVDGKSQILTDNAAVAGLEFRSLNVTDAAGVVLLDDIVVNGLMPYLQGCEGSVISGCAQVHVSRSLIHGKPGDEACESIGLGIVDSTVTLTGCTIVGGTGWGDDFLGYPGQVGLDVRGESAVLLAQTSVYGGDGGTPQILFGGQGGWGAEAIRVNYAEEAGPAVCIVRGTSTTVLQGGFAGLGIGGLDAWVAVSGWGHLVLSGVTYDPEVLGAGLDAVLPDPPQPFINLVGGDGPRAFKRLNLHGPAGAPMWVFASLDPAQFTVPGPVDGTIWLDLGTPVLILPTVLSGQQVPQNFTFAMPAVLTGFEGLVVTFQGFVPGMGASGNSLATNPAHLVVR